MATREDIVREFMQAMEVPYDQEFDVPQLELAMKLIKEECKELEVEVETMLAELGSGNTIDFDTHMNMVKELADLQYVVSYFAAKFNIMLDSAFKRVHYSNMSKLGDDGKPVKRADGKILKGPNYQPPYLRDIV